jgi:hypothetical protein
VDRLLSWFRDDVTETMTFLGVGSVREHDRSLISS